MGYYIFHIKLTMSVLKRSLYFYKEIQNVTVVPKLPFVFFNKIENFENCTQTTIRFFTMKHKILKTATKRTFMFLHKNIEFWKLYPNDYFYFPKVNARSNYLSSIWFCFLKLGKKLKTWFRDTLFCFLTMKNETRNIIELCNTHYSQKGS